MLSVKCLGVQNGGVRSLFSGSSFGYKDSPISFEVRSEEVEVPLLVNFFLRDDPSRGNVTLEVGNIQVGNTLDVVFFNSTNSGSSGLKVPAVLFSIKGVEVSLMFQVDRQFQADVYRLTYEFFESHQPGGAQ